MVRRTLGHPRRSKEEKRTVVWGQEQPEEVLQYLKEMQDDFPLQSWCCGSGLDRC